LLLCAASRSAALCTLSLHDALPIWALGAIALPVLQDALDRSLALAAAMDSRGYGRRAAVGESQRRTTVVLLIGGLCALCVGVYGDRKSTRLNSSHVSISYAVFCLKK